MADWPAHTFEARPWKQTVRGGTRDDRTLDSIMVALPPTIAGLPFEVSGDLVVVMERVNREIATLEAADAMALAPLRSLLLRTESVASSKIEQIEADVRDYARALHGSRANAAATSMAAATGALSVMIDGVDREHEITLARMLSAHRELMRGEYEAAYAGRVRDVQNWIGGSDHSPRDAMYIPPPPETVQAYLDDLVTFANRTDLPALVVAALAHAQFESIHPFTDGNGRIGRALVNSVLRRRGLTQEVVVPIASALVAERQRYFDLLDAYRAGEAAPIVEAFAQAALAAAAESRITATRLRELPGEWAEALGRSRRGSAPQLILEQLAAHPVLTAAEAEELTGVPASAVYLALARLVEAGVLIPLTDRKRDQIWGAADVLDELDDLNRRIGRRAVADSSSARRSGPRFGA